MTDPMTATGAGPTTATGTAPAAVDPSSDLHRLAAAMGELTVTLTAQVSPLPAMTSVQRERAALDGLAALHARAAVSDDELTQLKDLVGTVFAPDLSPDSKRHQAGDLLEQLRAAYASPAALAIASVAAADVGGLAGSVPEPMRQRLGELAADIGDFSTWQECACAGGIVGATAGIPFGPGGVLVMAAAGAAGGALAFLGAEELLS